MTYALEFEIEGLPRTANQLLGSNWKIRSGHADKWKAKVWRACWHLAPQKPLVKAKVTLTRCSSRIPDFDGLALSFKAVMDGLVRAGILADDSPKVVGQPIYIHETVGARKGKIRIRVEEICTT